MYEKLFDYLSEELGIRAFTSQMKKIVDISKSIDDEWTLVSDKKPLLDDEFTPKRYLCFDGIYYWVCTVDDDYQGGVEFFNNEQMKIYPIKWKAIKQL